MLVEWLLVQLMSKGVQVGCARHIVETINLNSWFTCTSMLDVPLVGWVVL